MMKVYISAPITGYDLEERKAFFKRMSDRLIANGFMPVNPMKNGIPVNDDIKKHYKKDFSMLLDCERILLCDGWERSAGCQKEATISLWCGITVLPKDVLGL